MKIILNGCYGTLEFSQYVKSIIKTIDAKDYIDIRINKDIINHIESNYDKIDDRDNCKTYVFRVDNGYNKAQVYSIFDADITRPWTIEEYDGQECIEYLDKYKCKNKELNYWE